MNYVLDKRVSRPCASLGLQCDKHAQVISCSLSVEHQTKNKKTEEIGECIEVVLALVDDEPFSILSHCTLIDISVKHHSHIVS